MSAPTPGPWGTGGTFIPGTPRASTWIWGPARPGDQSGEVVAKDVRLANARLIAAAPELLAELAAITTELAAEVGDSHPSVVRARALLRRVAG